MATFPSITRQRITRKKEVSQTCGLCNGDGYEQRTIGLNQNPKVWSLTFEVSETDADTIETFLDARADNAV